MDLGFFFFLSLFSVCMKFSLSLQNSFFLLARQDISLSDLRNSTDPLMLPCRRLGIWPHPTSCTEYVICRKETGSSGPNIVMEHYRCSFGIFDLKTKRCNWAKLSAPCKEGNVTLRLPDIDPALTAVSRKAAVSTDGNPVDDSQKSASSQRPVSYISELNGLTCKEPGYFPHPINSTKFYRCVTLYPENFMIYLFSCEAGLLYEPTVRACVKSLGEERMDTGNNFPINTQTPIWVVQRCRAMQLKPIGKTTALFRSPQNCRRFFRCTSTSISMKIEQFSCPTGLFFDQERKSCTWASETSECVTSADDLVDDGVWQSSLANRATPVPPTNFATVWVTIPKKATRFPFFKQGFLVTSATSSTEIPYEASTAAWLPPTTQLTPDEVIDSDMDPNWLFKQALKPPPYLTATGILVANPNEFLCRAAGVFPSQNPCVFYKCEKYTWVKNFLLFRFTCPPHTVFSNGTCEYNATVICDNSQDGPSENTAYSNFSLFTYTKPATQAPARNKIAANPRPRPMLCTKDGLFALPYASRCDIRFMVCRRLIGPLHFFVSVHECPPSLVFSSASNQCVDPVVENLQCTIDGYGLPAVSFEAHDDDEETPTASPPDDTIPGCATAGFTKVSCRRFRRCEWLLDNNPLNGSWVSYDFECGKGMIFDETVVACVRPTVTKFCSDPFQSMGKKKVVQTINTVFETTTDIISEEKTAAVEITQNREKIHPANEELQQIPISATDVTTPPSTTLVISPQETTTPSSTVKDDSEHEETSESPTTTAEATVTAPLLPSNTFPTVDDGNLPKENLTISVPEENIDQTTAPVVVSKNDTPMCYRSGYFLYPDDTKCQRFYRCLQLTPEPNSFVMLHYRCDEGYVFDARYFACSAAASAPPCEQVNNELGMTRPSEVNQELDTANGKPENLPVQILPQVWQMSANDSASTGALICTTQRIYRLQTCGYYYSCIETEVKGKFIVQEIYCETLYLDIGRGHCTNPPPNDPCNANSITRFSSIWSVRKATTKAMSVESTTISTQKLTTPIVLTSTEPTTSTESTTTAPSTTTTQTTTIPSTTTVPTTTSTLSTVTPEVTTPPTSSVRTTVRATTRRAINSTRHPNRPQVAAAIKIPGSGAIGNNTRISTIDLSSSVFISPAGSTEYFTPHNTAPFGAFSSVAKPVLQTTRLQAPTLATAFPPRISLLSGQNGLLASNAALAEKQGVESLSAYRDRFNQLYAQMNGRLPGAATSTMGTITPQPSLTLNFNSVSGQLNDVVKTGATFQCRTEGYFRKPRDVTCSRFYLCMKVSPHQYNLFEFMCLPKNGIQWKYKQDQNACVDPDTVRDC